jgi:hypothetical protein
MAAKKKAGGTKNERGVWKEIAFSNNSKEIDSERCNAKINSGGSKTIRRQ